MLYLLLLLAAYTPQKEMRIQFLNANRTVTVTTLDAWTDVDGLTDAGLTNSDGFETCRGTKGIKPRDTGAYRIRVYANYTKVAGANDVSFDFAITANGLPFPYFQTTVVPKPGSYLANTSTLVVPLTGGVCYGVAVRNTTNTDNITFRSYYLSLERVQ